MSVTFAPELGEAVRSAAAGAGLSLSEWLAQAAEAKIRAERGVLVEVERALRSRQRIRTNAMALAQAGATAKGRQVTLARALRDITVEPITREDGFRAGELLGATDMSDAIDATVALLAGPGDRVLTGDRADLRALCDAAGNKAVVVDC